MDNKKLKDAIRDEIDLVTNLLVKGETFTTYYALSKWLQSLQRIDKVCKDRNRY